MQKEIKILNIKFTTLKEKEILEKILKLLKIQKKSYICTPNPEMLLEAEKNLQFKKVLNNSIFNIPDGIGILWAAEQFSNKNSKIKAILTLPFSPLLKKKILKNRITGTDLMQKICQILQKTNYKIFLLGAKKGIAELAAKKLTKKYPLLKIAGTFAGSPFKKDEKNIINIINKSNADILFVAYGAPAQELWIAKNLKHLKTIKIAMGVGGAFDFISEKRKRAPKWMRKLGIEWLFRLIQEPSRIKRIYNAVIKFPITVIKKL
jgi:N-acetylglucosaminyldiphosphoundecaprenol N-acetyl-beta-D-mannosaminyltransferase